METCWQIWETRDDKLLCLAVRARRRLSATHCDRQIGHAAIAQYWDRVKPQDGIARVATSVVAKTLTDGVATWSTRYRVTSERMFAMLAKSAVTGMPERKPGQELPRLRPEAIAVIEFGKMTYATISAFGGTSQLADPSA